MKRFLILSIIFLLVNTLNFNTQAQVDPNHIGNYIWPIGNQQLSFCSNPSILLNNNSLQSISISEGYTLVSDIYCNIIMSSNGQSIINKNGSYMPNGMSWNLLGSSSSTQSSLIVPKPDDPITFYLFCSDNHYGPNGYTYSRIDMSLEGGLGDVDINEKNIPLYSPGTERLIATMHNNGIDIWVITHAWNSNEFISYLVTSSGVDTINPVVSAIGYTPSGSPSNARGYLKVSPSGTKLAIAIEGAELCQLFDFNTTTGVVSNPIDLAPTTMYDPYGIEFSPNEQFLYCSERWGNKIYQWDISSGSSVIIPTTLVVVGTLSTSSGGAMLVAPDGKIYIARNNILHLSVINNPNLSGLACGFNEIGVTTTWDYGEGLPNYAPVFVNYFNTGISIIDEVCSGAQNGEITANLSTLVNCDSILWSTGDTTNVISSLSAGTYYVTVYYDGGVMSIDTAIVDLDLGISISTNIINPTTNSINSGSIEIIPIMGVSPFSYVWSNGSTSSLISGLVEGVYYYTVTDANNCEITGIDTLTLQVVPTWTYTITGGNHTIFIPDSCQFNILGNPLAYGDFVGVFYDSLGTLKCGGYTMWTGSQAVVTAWAEDIGDDGFVSGEEFKWKVWRVADQLEYTVYAAYDTIMPNQGLFAVNGISKVDVLQTLTITGTISTTTKAELSNGVMITYEFIDNQYNAVDVTTITNGEYFVKEIEPGNYLCYAIPDPVNMEGLPYYYSATNSWQNGEIIEVIAPVADLNITLPAVQQSISGVSSISGKMLLGSDTQYNADLYNNDWFSSSMSSDSTIARNICVYLFNDLQILIDFRLSDSEGLFSFDELEYGTYYLRPEKAGSESQLIEIILSESQQNISDLVFTLNQGVILEMRNIDKENQISIFPNPANKIINIELGESISDVFTISLYEVNGSLVFKETYNSTNNAIISTDQFNSGVFICEISTKNFILRERIVVVKK